MSYLYIRITRPEGYEDVHPDLILQDMNIDHVWGAEVVDVETLLRECREALLHCEGVFDEVRGYPITYDLTIEATAKIDEVLE